MKLIYTTQPEIGIFSELVESLVIHKSQNILLLLCGGSTTDVYKYFAEKFDSFKSVLNSLAIKDLSNLTIGLTDDRWDKDLGNESINSNIIRKIGFYDLFESLGAKIITISKSNDKNKDALEYDKILKNIVGTSHGMSLHIISICGIGENYHTCAIFPNSNPQEFSRLYLDNDNYAVAETVDDVYPDRITITPQMLKKSNEVYIYLKGEKKKPLLNKLFNMQDGLLNEMPMMIYKDMENVKVYTDNLLDL